MPGEVIGLIGNNGAGKSTLLNAIGGYVPSKGHVQLLGRDVSRSSAHQRARRGLGRTFQAARLYPELTVRDTVQLALEARDPTSFWGSLLWVPSIRPERRKYTESKELIDFLGLGRYADRYVAELSTGTRRIVELATVLAVAPRVICLDEPTAGVAQREAEAFGPLILRIKEELDATLDRRRARPPADPVDQRPRLLPRSREGHRRGPPGRGARRPEGGLLVPRHRRPRHPAEQRRHLIAAALGPRNCLPRPLPCELPHLVGR